MKTTKSGKTYEQMIAGIPRGKGVNWTINYGKSALIVVRPVDDAAYTVECAWVVPEAYGDDVETFGHYKDLGQRATVGLKLHCADVARATEIAEDFAAHCETRTESALMKKYPASERVGNVSRKG